MDRRVRTNEETESFVGFIEELVTEGLRADAGQFKPGSFEKLTAKMNDKYLGVGFQTSHCKNKFKRLKEKFQFAADMAACSGFGWDDVKQCVVVDNKEILAAYMKKQGQMLYTPGKPLSLYPRLEKIFVRDRATGAAVCGNDAEEQVQKDGDDDMDDEDIAMFNSSPEFTESLLQQDYFVASSSERKQGKKASSSKSTKEVKMMKELTDTLKYVFDEHGKRLDAFTQVMANTRKEKKTGDVLSELSFTYAEIVKCALKFAADPQLEKAFLSLGDSQKAGFVREFVL
ncbi:hypothetical protein PIB30_118470 [Stylosanthes scabra]|uniref:Myb/SANT-like domain-containing protein n=1 Tax=Stylosanthes scabra TaxID=79078 RepID=A0ABU6Q7P6_9FABA|nr:hypothetical protein [Stylosanthes scabra]